MRHAFEGDHGEAETFRDALQALEPQLPISRTALRRKSTLVAGLQTALTDFCGQLDRAR